MGERNKGRRKRRQKPFWVVGSLGVAVVGFFAWSWIGSRNPSPDLDRHLVASGDYVRRETRKTLSPALFVGKTRLAYQVAQEIPDVLDQLYCYCGCDRHMGHVSLLSCFTDTHGAT